MSESVQVFLEKDNITLFSIHKLRNRNKSDQYGGCSNECDGQVFKCHEAER